MGRITNLFAKKKQRVLNVYCTAGYPLLQSTLPVMRALQDNGADMIELGIPYSDPLASCIINGLYEPGIAIWV